MCFEAFVMAGRGLLLAYDQGPEHGPTHFDRRMIDRSFVMDLFKMVPGLRALVDEARTVEGALRA